MTSLQMTNFSIPAGSIMIAATASDPSPAAILIHPGVGDRRCWRELMGALLPEVPTVAIDMRGFGDTPPSAEPFSSTSDIDAVVREYGDGAIALVGNSFGGGIAIDYALAHPGRVRRLVLIAPALSGSAEPDWVAELGQDVVDQIEAAEESGDLDALNRWEARIWLDGHNAAEDRVAGAARELFLQMNHIALTNEGAPGPLEPPPAIDRLEDLTMPVLVIVGTRDLPHQRARSALIAQQVRDGRLVEMEGVAHLPQLEDPTALARIIGSFLAPQAPGQSSDAALTPDR